MRITFFKSRCLVCLKGSEVPLLSDYSYGDSIFFDKKELKYSYFSWFDNTEIESCIKEYFTSNPEIQLLNDNTKGNTAKQIVGLIADGEKEFILNYNRCPRCGLKFIYVSDIKTEIKEIETLQFTCFLNLDNNARQQYILERTKNSL